MTTSSSGAEPFSAIPTPAASHMLAPLCVDLDGTLIKTDLLLESLLVLLKKRSPSLFRLPVWLLSGRARLKREVTARVALDVAALPYREELLAYLREAKSAGRTLVLATAADQHVAARVAEHVGLFDRVVASDGRVNNAGADKLRALQRAFPEGAFVYAGDALVDLQVWCGASGAVVVGERLAAKVEAVAPIERVFPVQSRWRELPRALRVHQWVKNLLIVVPLVLAHQLRPPQLAATLLAFVAFGLLASATYVLNDLLDLEADRHHPRKRLRPFAAGALPLKLGFALVPALLASSALVALALPPAFGVVLAGYFVTTLAYSLHLKRVPIVDVITLALLYTVRIIAGTAATGLEVTPWLLAFSTFFFLHLAFVKRLAELQVLRQAGDVHDVQVRGRGYHVEDFEGLANLGASSGYVSVLVVALYISSPQVADLYRAPLWLWLLCPLLLFWISRVWLLTHRGQMHDDPVLFALRDRVSYAVGALALVIGAAATWGWG